MTAGSQMGKCPRRTNDQFDLAPNLRATHPHTRLATWMEPRSIAIRLRDAA